MNRQLRTSLTPATLRGRSALGQARCIMAVAVAVVAIVSCCFIVRHAGATNGDQSARTGGRGNTNISAAEGTPAPAQDTNVPVPGCVAPPSGMVAWLPGDGHAADISGNGNSGNPQGGVTFPAGKVAQAFDFDGTGDVTYSTINAGAAYTVDFWLRPTRQVGAENLVSNMFRGGTQNYGQLYFTNNHIQYNQGGALRLESASGSVPLNAYTHVALTYDGQVNRLYLNGNLAATSDVHTGETFNNPIRLGYSIDNTENRFAGQLDEIEIFSRTLSQTEVRGIFNADTVGKCKGGTLQFDPTTYTVNENAATATITVTRTVRSIGAVTLNYATADGTATGGATCAAGVDYRSSSGTLSWADGDASSKTFAVPICDDPFGEPIETVNLTLSNPTGGAELGSQRAATLNIDSGPAFPLAVSKAGNGSGTVTSNPTGINCGANCSASYDSGVPVTLTATPATGSLFTGWGGACASSGTNPTCTVTVDAAKSVTANFDLPPNLTINDVSVVEGNTGTVNASFAIALSAPINLPVTVDYATANGTATAPSDYQSTAGTLTIPANSPSATLTVAVNGDTLFENNETFFVNLSNAGNATITDAQGQGTIQNDDAPPPQPNAGDVIISEFRFRGPTPAGGGNGALDEFVELYNKTDAALAVGTTDGAGWALVAADGLPRVIIPNGTVLPARGHYLVVNNSNPGGYSLSNYGGSGTAAGDATYTTDIADNAGLALFRTASAANFTLANRLDAVGSNQLTGANADLYREGAGLPPASTIDGEYSFVRKLTSGVPQDTGDNAQDFAFVSTDPSRGPLGAPGPENLASPSQRNAQIKASLIEPQQASTNPPNRVRDTTPNNCNGDTAPSNCTLGTLDIRRRFRNMTGQTLTQLRFRIVDVTAGAAPSGTADLRALSGATITLATPTSIGVTSVLPTTMETPPGQPGGGGLNTSLLVTLPGGGLVPMATVDLHFLIGVQQSGSFRFFVNVEALTASSIAQSKGSGGKQGGGSTH